MQMGFSITILIIVLVLVMGYLYCCRNNKKLLRGGANEVVAVDKALGTATINTFFVNEPDAEVNAAVVEVDAAIAMFEEVAKLQLRLNEQRIITYVQTYPASGEVRINSSLYRDINITNELTVVGDLHGDKETLDAAIKYWNKKDTLIFTGDYVDRGENSYDVIHDVCALKMMYPYKVFMCRGNHETLNYISLNSDEMLDKTVVGQINNKYGASVSAAKRRALYEAICKVYATMNLIVIFNRVNMCLHGEFVDSGRMLYPICYEIGVNDIIRCTTWGDFPSAHRRDLDCAGYNLNTFIRTLLRYNIINYIKGHNHDFSGAKVSLNGDINYIVNTSSRTVSGISAKTFDRRTLREKDNYESYLTQPTVVHIDRNANASFVQLRWFMHHNEH